MKVLSKAFNIITNSYYYKLIMIVAAFLYVFPFTMVFMGFVLKFLLIWGIIVVAVTYLKDKSLFKNKLNCILFGFLIFSFIGVISNYHDNFMRDLLDWTYLVVFCLAFINVDKNKSKDMIYKELFTVSALVVYLSFFVSLTSFILYIICFKGSVMVQGQEYLFGDFENRLFGILGNPNSGALLSLISIFSSLIILSIIRFMKTKNIKKGMIYFFRFNIVLQFIVLFLSNSRSAIIAIIVGCVIIFFALGKKIFTPIIKNTILQFIICIIMVCVGCSAIYGASIISNKIIGYIPMAFSYFNIEVTDNSNNNIKKEVDSLEPTENEREYKTKDISSGRYDIWTADLKVAKQYIFTGVGSANVIDKVNKYFQKKSRIASNTHNIYLEVLVSNGIFSLILILAYFGSIVFMGIKKILKSKNIYEEKLVNCLLIGLVLSIMAENLFDSNLLGFMNLLIVPVFWTYLGYAVDFINRKENLPDCEKGTVSD